MENGEVLSVFHAYATCRMRDACLRYMNENPRKWLDVTSTPCPCSFQHWRKVAKYSMLLQAEANGAELLYSREMCVDILTQTKPREKKPDKVNRREIPISQKRLSL